MERKTCTEKQFTQTAQKISTDPDSPGKYLINLQGHDFWGGFGGGVGREMAQPGA